MGGSSGGARPKALVSIDRESWIVKFPSSYDRKSVGEEEYRYVQCAKKSEFQCRRYACFHQNMEKDILVQNVI
ncbi:MAG: HipA domain-containing protein [Blautia sp.]|nr:HipA domain-containing protein [Blautia sp.]MDY4000825.1 HipA domain-containing protein [Blautia sp.]